MSHKTRTNAHFPDTSTQCCLLTRAAQRLVVLLASALAGVLGLGSVGATEYGEGDIMALSFDQLLEVNVEKVYGASKYEQTISQAPSAVSLVTRDEIQKQGYRTIADVLRSVNGVYVSDDRNYSYIGIRGFSSPGDYNSRVLLLVDGHRLNDNVYDQALVGREGFLDVDLIERVEVIRGPSSSIYGNNAFFGVINVITRSGASVNGLETSGEAGTHETYSGRVTYGKLLAGEWDLLVSGSFYDSAGERRVYFPEFDAPATNDGMAENADGERAMHFFAALGNEQFKLTGGFAWRRKDVPTASFLTTFNDGGEQTEDKRAYLDLKGGHEFSEALQLIGHVAYDYSWYRGEYPYGAGLGRFLNLDESEGQSLSADWQLNWQALERCKIILGGDLRESLSIEQLNWDQTPFNQNLFDQREGRNFGVFGQAEVRVLTNLTVNAGVRFDHYSTFGDTANPRLALIYAPWERTTFKALYGEAYRAPNAYELYYAYPGQSKANPNLQPEEIRTYELVWEQALAANLRFTASAYHYDVDNLAAQIIDPGDGLLVFENQSTAQANGLELGFEARFTNGFVARVGYTLQKAEDDATGFELSNSPHRLAKLNVIAPLWSDRVFAGLDLQYSSPVATVLGNRSDDVLLLNLTVFSRPLGENFEIAATLYNALDERKGFSASTEHVQDTIPLARRAIRLKATYRF